MNKVLTTAALAILVPITAHGGSIVGDWQGTLKAGGAELHLVLHITQDEQGALKATLDSVDQGANGIPVSAVTLKDSRLNLTVDAIQGTYEGTVNAEATEIKGTWSQGQPLPLDFQRATTLPKTGHKPAKPSDIDGAWMGTLEAGAMKVRVVFHITNTEDGLTATMDSPDQNAKGISVTTVTRNGSSLKMEVKPIGGAFNGNISADLLTVEGTWTQGPGILPLVLKRVKDTSELERRRPQNPAKPYPYHEEEVAYKNDAAGIKVAGTLTLPTGHGPFRAVLLICGSGPHDRDESLMGHKPFLVLADFLTRHGVAVLRADKRGVGQSGGNYASATMRDFATDAEAGVAYLKSRPEVDPHRIGLIGHSEGGVIAPMVAARNRDVAFIVMMAGTGVPGDEVLVAQALLINETSGKTHAEAEAKAAKERQILTLVKQEKDDAVLEKKVKEIIGTELSDVQIGAQVKALTSPWLREFIAYDPATALRQVTCPVLAINGEKDMQVPPKQNLPVIRQALEAAGNRHFEVDELPGLNHLFQTARTGAVSEYAEIEETMSPLALEKIASWIQKQ